MDGSLIDNLAADNKVKPDVLDTKIVTGMFNCLENFAVAK